MTMVYSYYHLRCSQHLLKFCFLCIFHQNYSSWIYIVCSWNHLCILYNFLSTFDTIPQNIHLHIPNTLLNCGKLYNVPRNPGHICRHIYRLHILLYNTLLCHRSCLYRQCYILNHKSYHSINCFYTPCTLHLTDKKSNFQDNSNN